MSTCFVDSTVLLYPLDQNERTKGRRSEKWLKRLRLSSRLVLSPQVLNETYWAVWRKPRFEPARGFVRDYLAEYVLWTSAALSPQTTIEAWRVQDRYQIRFWDALMLASASAAGCTHFLSEDLNDGQSYAGVVAINPFRHAPEDVLGPAA